MVSKPGDRRREASPDGTGESRLGGTGASFDGATRSSTIGLLGRGLLRRCPACGARHQFRFWVVMNESCHRCGLTFERIEGHWIGAIGINTIVSFGILLGFLVVSLVATFPDFPVVPLMIGNGVVAVVVPILFFPISRTLWTAIDIAMRPLEAHEVDWSAIEDSWR